MELTDEQWSALEPLLPKPVVRSDGRGRPWRDPRDYGLGYCQIYDLPGGMNGWTAAGHTLLQ